MDERAWDRMGLDPDKRHRRLAPLWNPWEDCPSASAIEYREDGPILCRMSVPGFGVVVFHESGGISLASR